MIFVLCFEDCRAYLKNIVESLIYEWNSLYKDTKDEKGICLACFLMLFITLILLFCCLLFFKAGQADAMTACFSEYSRKVLSKAKSNRVPIREQLQQAADQLSKEKPKQKERAKEVAHEDR